MPISNSLDSQGWPWTTFSCPHLPIVGVQNACCSGAGDRSQGFMHAGQALYLSTTVPCSLSLQKIKTIVSFQPGMVVWPCNFCTQEDETGGLLWALGQPVITVRLCLCERERNKEKTQACILPYSIYLLKQIQGTLRKRVKKQPNVFSRYFQREQLPSYCETYVLPGEWLSSDIGVEFFPTGTFIQSPMLQDSCHSWRDKNT